MQTKMKRINVLKWIITICLSGSFSLLSFYQIVDYQKWIIISTVVLSFLIALFFINQSAEENMSYVKLHYGEALAAAIISLLVIWAMHDSKGIPNIDKIFPPLPFRFFKLRWWLLAAPAVFYLSVFIWKKMKLFLLNLWNDLSLTEKKIYLAITLISSLIILINYFISPQWYLQYDMVYSIDSGWCYKSIFPQLSYYDIRHPVLSIITFPIYAIVQYVLQIFVPKNLCDVLCVSCIQIINAQLLIMIGFMIGKLSRSRWVSLLYFASAPTLLFTLFLEKYQICVFVLMLYVYKFCREERQREFNIVLASGAMPTSIFLVLSEGFVHESIGSKIKRLSYIALQGIAFLICAGRIQLLNPVILQGELISMAERFGLKGYSLKECLYAFLNMVQGTFLSLTSERESIYIWVDIVDRVSLVAIVITIIILVGVWTGRRELFVKVCTVWMISAFVLIVGFQWSVDASPLFCVYFSWALISLFQRGIQNIIDKFHWNANVVYPAFLILMFAVNISNMIDISLFLVSVK